MPSLNHDDAEQGEEADERAGAIGSVRSLSPPSACDSTTRVAAVCEPSLFPADANGTALTVTGGSPQ
jgi:hypothetical protein